MHTVWFYANTLGAAGRIAALAVAAMLLAGCEKEELVRTYRAPKEPAVKTVAAPAPAVSAVPTWTVPAGWKELKAQEMRYAAFAVSPEHPNVVMTVVPLGAEAGGLAANVVRWQGQIGMPATPEAEVEKLVSHADVNGLHVDKVDLVGPEPGEAGKPRQRILAAVIEAGGRTWFFKLMGPADVVAAQKANFDAFVGSVKFEAAPGDPSDAQSAAADARTPAPRVDPPATDGQAVSPAPAPARAAAPAPAAPSRITHGALPAGWTAGANNQPPRVATFKVEASGQQAELAVTKFPGTAIGTFADNVNRWRGQIGLAPVADAGGYQPKIQTLGGEQWAIVEVVGEDKPGAPGSAQRILVGMTTPGGEAAREIWFFKLQGPSKLVADQRPAFEKFLDTVKFANAE